MLELDRFAEDAPPRLCLFVRDRRDEIIRRWTEAVRGLSPAKGVGTAALVDHLPEILARMADQIEGPG